MKAKVNGTEIHYTIEGEGPWITLSHSLACDSSMWDPQIDMLKKNFKVLRFDTRGHGQSARLRANTHLTSWPTTCTACSARSASPARTGWVCRWVA